MVAAVVLGATGAVGASAAPAPPGGGAGTLPPKPEAASDNVGILKGSAYVAKPRTAVVLPVQVQRVYAAAESKIDLDAGTLTTKNLAFVITNPGPDEVYGVFPDTVTTILGFGALPVTATLHLTQLADADGVLVPIVVDNVANINVPFDSTTTLTGQVTARLSDVTVDQVPLDVGPACTTAVPVTLTASGKASGTIPGPGEYAPFPGGTLKGEFTLPPFSGCGVDGQDLDPLLTGTVSGPGNKIILNQSPLGDYDPTQPNDCRNDRGRPCRAPTQPPLPTP